MATKSFFITADELKAAYDTLGSPQKVADKYGVSKKLVLNYMKKFGIARDKRKTITFEVEEVIRSMAVRGCGAPEISKTIGFSGTAIRKWAKKNGVELKDPTHPGYQTTHAGYIKVRAPEHPRADSKGYVHEHVLVMEAHIGRYLLPHEVVHHKDHSKANNRIENLQLMSDSEHRALHLRQKDSGRWATNKQQDIV
jgi:hypothetical protein